MQPQLLLYGGAAVLFLLAILILPSIHVIGPTEVGLVMKRFSFKRLSDDNPVAFNGEAGYQAALGGGAGHPGARIQRARRHG